MTVAQLWCDRCEAEVVARLHDDASGERLTARCPWCDHAIDVPEEAA